MKRAAAYGWSSTRFGAGAELGGQRWSHNDAGGDLTPDGGVRQRAWLQVSVAEDLNAQHLPVLPAVTVLSDALHRMGAFRFTGLHALVPLHLAPDSRFDLAGDAAWFALADPASSMGLMVTLSARETSGLHGRTAEIRALALARTFGRMTLERVSPGQFAQQGLAGELQRSDMQEAMAFRCVAPEWSPDIAAWVTEVLVDALRAAGVAHPALLTVSITP
ncbi:hypothetical protein ACFPK5_29585 [Streptomyces beijiangensis]|uniref:hypothetical protein n=1 Tax=Streptomyces beijiangensis TaxID=163361 RepID=UPI0036073901